MNAKANAEKSCTMGASEGACVGWGAALRLWWAITWRTLLIVNLPLMLIQVGITYLQSPEMVHAMVGMAMMMSGHIGGFLLGALLTPEFWFFVAVSVYSVVGAMYVYLHLAHKRRFGGVEMTLTRVKK